MPRVSDDQSRDQSRQAVPAREEKGSGAGTAILLVIVGLLFVVGPFILGSYVKIPLLSQIIISAFGVAMLVAGGIMFTITQLYEKATMNEAFVRTGVGGPKVVQDGAAIVIPAIHRITRVSLETIRLEIERLTEKSFITGDSLHVDVRAQFYIRVNRDEESIKAAATSLGSKSGVDELIMGLVGDKLVSGLRTVAGRRDLDYLHAHVDEYSEEVKKIVEADIAHNGLFLESVTVTYLNQTPLSNLKPEENIFDAQGARKIAAVTNAQRVEISKIKTGADQEVKQQEVARDQELFRLSIQRETTEAQTNLNIDNAKAEAARKAAEFQAEQDRLSRVAQVTSAQAVEIAGVEKEQAVQVATAQQEKAVQSAQISKAQEVETRMVAKEQAVQAAGVERQKTIEVATREQQIAVADAERRRAEAEAARITAETERTRAEQNKLTVEKTAAAEREKNVAVIAKESTAQQTKIERNMEADVTAYTTVKQATASKEAAEANAEALRVTAQGQKDALTLEAEGDQAKAMVPVNVARQEVTVDQAKVDVQRTRLENQEKFGQAGIELQVRLAQIEKERAMGIAAVEALGRAIASADLKIIGDATMMQSIMASFYRGQNVGAVAEGFLKSAPKEVTEIAFETIDRVSGAVSNLAKTMFGKDVPADLIATMVKTELAKQAPQVDGIAAGH